MLIEENKTVVGRSVKEALHDFWQAIFGLVDHKLPEGWAQFDRLRLWPQLSVIPATVECRARVNKPYRLWITREDAS
jgi:hypothetical protein